MTMEERLEETLAALKELAARGVPIVIWPTVVVWPPGARSIADVCGGEDDTQDDQLSPKDSDP